MIKLIACDLDETLLNSKKEIGEANKEAIKKAINEYGIKFVPATGRGFYSVDNILDELGLKQQKEQYVISANGSILTENYGHRIVALHPLSKDIIEKCFEFGIKHQLCMQIFTLNDVYAFQIDDDERAWLYAFKPDAIELNNNEFEQISNMQIVKVMFQNTNLEYLFSLEKELYELLNYQVKISYSSHRYMEINDKMVSKGMGLIDLAKLLNIKIEETMAIGDNYNDESMLQVAGISIAVNNAYDNIKAIVDYICDNSNEEAGVAEAINKFIFEGDNNG